MEIIVIIIFFVLVINVTFPDDKQNYIHRIGRVGRADRWVATEKNIFIFLETD